jgi:hypothetical protein
MGLEKLEQLNTTIFQAEYDIKACVMNKGKGYTGKTCIFFPAVIKALDSFQINSKLF